jgi:hypothetical protein
MTFLVNSKKYYGLTKEIDAENGMVELTSKQNPLKTDFRAG